MKTKSLEFKIPEYLTVEQYSKMSSSEGGKVEKMIDIISALTGYSNDEVSKWSITSLNKVFDAYKSLLDNKNEFHSLIEWNGTLYGYSHINAMTLGCYVDLENLSKDLDKNLHKVAAILYRPVTKHRFKSLSFAVKQKIKMLNNQVENVFDFYEIEEYDNKVRKDREEDFKEFPAHILLGAIGFFLGTGSLYLNDIAYLEKTITKKKRDLNFKKTLERVSQSIGVGGGLFTTSVSPTYLTLQGTKV